MKLSYKKTTSKILSRISGIGNSNQRLVWMRYRWLMPNDWEPRVLRLLDLGNVVEDDLIKKLRKILGLPYMTLTPTGNNLRLKHWVDMSRATLMA